MRGLAVGLVVWMIFWAPLQAQGRDRSLDRISFALQQPSAIVRSDVVIQSDLPKRLGFLTLVPPTKQGEVVRISIPIGELVSRAFRGVGAANQRRQEGAARRRVEAALDLFADQQASPKR